MGRVTERRKVIRIRDGAVSTRPDTLVAEEPLEIRLNGKPLAITMRTPGDDFALAAGFLVSEGVLGAADDLQNIVYCAGATADGSNTYNVVDVRTAPGVVIPDITLERNVYTTSSCGLCGKASLDAVRTTARWPDRRHSPGPASNPSCSRPSPTGCARPSGSSTGPGACTRRPCSPRTASCSTYGRTWAGTTRSTSSSAAPCRTAACRCPAAILLVSGRASFELAQKAVMAGIPVLAAVSAPSSLAVDLAAETGLTLVGFLRGSSMNVYAGEHRIALRAAAAQG